MDITTQEIEEQTKEEDYAEGCFKENYMVPHVCPIATGGWCKDYTKCKNIKLLEGESIMKKVLCWKCRCLREYTITTKKVIHKINGENFESEDKVATCNECGEEITVPGLDDENMRVLESLYKKTNGKEGKLIPSWTIFSRT